MQSKIFLGVLVVAAIFALVMWQNINDRKSIEQRNVQTLNDRMTARFAAFDALSISIKNYTDAHGNQPPASIDDVLAQNPAPLAPALVSNDQASFHNLAETILLINVACKPPGGHDAFNYKWAIFLFTPAATMPEGFPRTADYLRWSGQPDVAGSWPGGFTSATEAAGYFAPDVIAAAKAKAQEISMPATLPANAATKP
jgi:hypothetical protein